MSKPVPPCKGCAFRNVVCHTRCDGYKDFRERVKEWLEIIKAESQTERDAEAVRFRRIRSVKKSKRKADRKNGK